MKKSMVDIIFLSSLMKDTSQLSGLKKEVLASDFSSPIYYDIYKEIVQFLIDNKPSSYSTLRFKFKNSEFSLEVISEMEKEEFVTDNLNDAYSELSDNAQLLKLRVLNRDTSLSLKEGLAASVVLANIEAEVLKISSSANMQLTSIGDIERKMFRGIYSRMKRYRETGHIEVEMSTGFDRLDLLTLGFQRGSTYLLGASTSDGKTQMAVQMSNAVIDSGKSVLYFLLEDEREKLFYRFLSLKTGIKLFNIISGKLSDKEFQTLQKVSDCYKQGNNLFIDDTANDINDIVNKVRFAKLKHPDLGLVVVDYLGLAVDKATKYGNRETEISAISKKILNVAKSCNVAALKIVQLNTNPEDRSKGMAIRMNDVRDSKAPGHDASVSLFISYPNKNDEDLKFSKKEVELILAKNRYGEANKIIKLINKADVAKFMEE